MTVLDTVNNVAGTFISASSAPPDGSQKVIYTATMSHAETQDPSDTLRIGVEADFGAGFKHMQWGPFWTGGPGQVAPSFTWQWGSQKPLRTRAVLENVTQVVTGLAVSYV